ncbi:MAG: hydantoinase, partial [Candidatus Nanopelagicales bacterium]
DIAIVDPPKYYTVTAADSMSTQEYPPFEGFELGAKVTNTFLRGEEIYDGANVVGQPAGQYQFRPTA